MNWQVVGGRVGREGEREGEGESAHAHCLLIDGIRIAQMYVLVSILLSYILQFNDA